MSIINLMPHLLAESEPPIPEYIQYGYAFHTLRSILGRGRYDSMEDRIVMEMYRQEIAETGLAVERWTEPNEAAIRARFEVEVRRVMAALRSDGQCFIRTQGGGMVWTGSPKRIAAELNCLPAVVRQAQWQLRKIG